MSSQPPTCAGCPLYGIGTGFVLGSGNPRVAKIGLLLEAPGHNELLWQVDEEEWSLRKIAYPEMPTEFLKRGMPVVGKSGSILFSWSLASVQLTRRDLFIDNVLRCLPPTIKGNQYPTGEVRKQAEFCCRQYDRWEEFNGTVLLENIHPAAIAREPTPLPLINKTFEKAKHFSLQGERPIVTCGGKAAKVFKGYGENVSTFLGDYNVLKSDWYKRVLGRLDAAKGLPKTTRIQSKVAKKTSSARKGTASEVLQEQQIENLSASEILFPSSSKGRRKKKASGLVVGEKPKRKKKSKKDSSSLLEKESSPVTREEEVQVSLSREVEIPESVLGESKA